MRGGCATQSDRTSEQNHVGGDSSFYVFAGGVYIVYSAMWTAKLIPSIRCILSYRLFVCIYARVSVYAQLKTCEHTVRMEFSIQSAIALKAHHICFIYTYSTYSSLNGCSAKCRPHFERTINQLRSNKYIVMQCVGEKLQRKWTQSGWISCIKYNWGIALNLQFVLRKIYIFIYYITHIHDRQCIQTIHHRSHHRHIKRSHVSSIPVRHVCQMHYRPRAKKKTKTALHAI